jgi:hypothetical protein
MPKIKNLQKTKPDAFETVLATLKETGKRFKETELLFKETRDQMKETDRLCKENAERMKELQQTVGGWSNSHGFFAEEYFINSFKMGQKNFFGEKFDEFRDHVKPARPKKEFDDEYDILLINGKSVGIIETKFKLRERDMPKVFRKPETFRENFPEFKNHQVYLGVAALTFDTRLEQECIRQGIAIIKQVGDTVVIEDGHLKTF